MSTAMEFLRACPVRYAVVHHGSWTVWSGDDYDQVMADAQRASKNNSWEPIWDTRDLRLLGVWKDGQWHPEPEPISWHGETA